MHKQLDKLKSRHRSRQSRHRSRQSRHRSHQKAHPHFGDFQMILMALHRLEDAAGSARTQVSEQELSAYNNKAHALDTIPYSQLQNWSVKYADRISKKILEHIDGLDVNVGSSDRPEDVARRRVRAELKKLVPYLPTIVRDVATEQMTPDHNNSVFRMRIYGEPFLPNHHSVDPILRKLRATHISRSSFTFNMVRFNVPSATYHQTIALNGKEVDGAKLIVRFSMGMNYKVKPELKLSMATAFDPASNLDPMALADMEEEIGFENGGSWDE
ncbi:uncharacterized protein LOC114358922 [Ostrinia furnacalis]|uniref:uncharacterized protein LOC114358922 n=1 Tax=Ostrinia furnacalis TaxID=93504 RepID=UPI00103B4130|nr:uncharacterized protein LOC114358922 [Ostrinia furnacalis]